MEKKTYKDIWNDGYDILALKGKTALWEYLEEQVALRQIDLNDARHLNSDILVTYSQVSNSV